jgi:hypothetical protein
MDAVINTSKMVAVVSWMNADRSMLSFPIVARHHEPQKNRPSLGSKDHCYAVIHTHRLISQRSTNICSCVFVFNHGLHRVFYHGLHRLHISYFTMVYIGCVFVFYHGLHRLHISYFTMVYIGYFTMKHPDFLGYIIAPSIAIAVFHPSPHVSKSVIVTRKSRQAKTV